MPRSEHVLHLVPGGFPVAMFEGERIDVTITTRRSLLAGIAAPPR
jgi:hypothetical protein